MTWLLEDPTPVLVVGAIAVLLLAVVFYQTGLVKWLLAIIGVLALVAGLFLLERLVITEREQVENTIYAAAAAAEADDVENVLSMISKTAPQTRDRARLELSTYRVKAARIRSLEVTLNQLTSPPSARAVFWVNLDIADRQGRNQLENYPVALDIVMRREGDVWKLGDYEIKRGL